jgi:NAD(P)-dependent dehydrogenase (short-subunit alcohol dehydrogenase family)
MPKFVGKSVVVSGAGSGIGFALWRAFAAVGATVAINDLTDSLALQAAQKINSELDTEQVLAYGCDVADVQAARQMIQAFAAKTNRLDVVIANAGITNYGEFLSYTPEAFDRITGVNLRGSYFTAQTAANIMIANKTPGRILLLSSVTGERAFLNLGAYGMTKAAIRHIAKSVALEVGQYKITANAISPGAIVTERTLKDDPNFETNWAGVTPGGRAGYVADIVATALFLASPEAAHINGQTITVDGGWTLPSPLPAEHPEKPEHSSQLR